MKRIFLGVPIILLFVVLQTRGQVTNLKVNGVSSNFTMISGDTVMWEYNIPNGATATAELWYDVNNNDNIDPGTDVNLFTFNQTDGVAGDGGPGDLDGMVNGHIIFYTRVGFAPGKYVFKVTQGGSSQQVAGTVTALPSPAHTISGNVTPPVGKSKQNIFVELHRSDQFGEPNFWHGITDVNGNYSIQMNADTAGNPWRIRLLFNPFPPYVVSPDEIPISIITGNYSGNNFTFLQAAAQVAGTVKDENNNPLPNVGVNIFRTDGNVNRQGQSSGSGFFQLGLLASDLSNQTAQTVWVLQGDCNCENGVTTTYLTPTDTIRVIHSGDSLYHPLVYYISNSQIRGRVRVNGGAPNFPIFLAAVNPDTAQAGAMSDSATGNFTFQVTNKIRNYSIFAFNLPPNYQQSNSPVAHPGDTGIVVNVSFVSSVKEREPGIPADFTLEQNYPNPFNPTTTIDYDLPTDAVVQLTVFDVLGREVERLVNGKQNAGKYRVALDASKLGTGVYFYRLTAVEVAAGSPKERSITKKMIVMK
jgi:hypothetical protein